MKTYEDLNTAMMAAYTVINWVIANYDHTKVQTELEVWQYEQTKEWHIEVTTISEHSIVIPEVVIPESIKPNEPQINEFKCETKRYTSKSYQFKIK